MMSLEELIRNDKTDKNTTHSYIPLYQKLLEGKKETAKNVLEVGIYDGGSIKLWSEFFTNATTYGLDIIADYHIWDELKNKYRIKLYTSYDAYDEITTPTQKGETSWRTKKIFYFFTLAFASAKPMYL